MVLGAGRCRYAGYRLITRASYCRLMVKGVDGWAYCTANFRSGTLSLRTTGWIITPVQPGLREQFFLLRVVGKDQLEVNPIELAALPIGQ
jgi:hypothetical protein